MCLYVFVCVCVCVCVCARARACVQGCAHVHNVFPTELNKSGDGPWPEERSSHAACCLNYGQQFPQLLVSGGLDRQAKPLADLWILDIERENWRKVRQTFHHFLLCVWFVYEHYVFPCCLCLSLLFMSQCHNYAGGCYSEGSLGSLSHSLQSWSRTDRGGGFWRVSRATDWI